MKFFPRNSPVPRLFSFAAAACSALLLFLAMPGHFGWWPLLFIGLVPVLLLAPLLTPRRAACMGMFCGLLYNISLLYWIVVVLGRYGRLPAWISVSGMGLLAGYMALYFALFCLIFNLVTATRSRAGDFGLSPFFLAAPVIWVGLDYVRGVLFSGFPWMDLGYGLYRQPLLIQAADLGGHHLVTFYLVLVNVLLAAGMTRIITRSRRTGNSLFFVAAIVFLLGICGYSLRQYQQYSAAGSSTDRVVVSAIQGNIAQDEKWTPAKKEETVADYLALSAKVLRRNKVDLIIWPETALPFFPQQDVLMGKVIDFVRAENTVLLTGAPYFERNDRGEAPGKKVELFNSALLVNARGRLTGRYNKQHLVPFGEYVPLRSYLPFLEPLVVSVGDFTAGSSSTFLQTGRIKAGVLICFESIFPDIARKEVRNGSNLLVNITNDAWYGRSSAPYQSLAMSVFRAVENRRSLVRAANTGLSGLVDAVGKIHFQSRLFQKAAITVPVALLEEQTPFNRGGYWFGLVCCLLTLPVILCARRK